jgi:2-dehydro-3-deoxyphosphogluconate aldolase/(4S)-4-hydroxy-2-oxoglutarate aldolase
MAYALDSPMAGTLGATLQQLLAGKAIAVLRADAPDRLLAVARTLMEAGVTSIEFTLTTPGALEVIGEAARSLSSTGALIGAGTVLDAANARRVIAAGAKFVVTPALSSQVIGQCKREGVVVIAGALTPTEVVQAWELGSDLVKVFPAGVLGPAYIRALRAPLPHIPLVPTGGITPDNAADYLRAGAAVVGVGGALTGGGGPLDLAVIAQRARALRAALDSMNPTDR